MFFRLFAFCSVLLLLAGIPGGAEARRATLLSAKNQTENTTAAAAACKPVLPSGYKPIAQRYRKGIIFRIDSCPGVPPSYLMGTMHHDDPAFAPLIADAKRLILMSQAIGFEYVEDERSQQVALQYMLLLPTDPKGLNTLLTPQEYETLERVLTSRTPMPPQVVNRLRPWAAALLLQYPKSKSDGIALDSRLQKYAIEQDKLLFGLETPEQQYDVFASLPADMQLRMLKDGLAEIDAIDESNAALAQAYIARDLIRISRLAEKSFAEMKDRKLADYMQKHLILRRNRIMAGGLAQRLPFGAQFAAIGALHLPGRGGVLELLESEGYAINNAD